MTSVCHLFALSNSVNVKTCAKNMRDTSRDIMLTNKPRSFYNTSSVTTVLSDCYKIILSCFRDPKNYEMIKSSFQEYEEAFTVFSLVFRYLVKAVRG